jgi:hypothetical protein
MIRIYKARPSLNTDGSRKHLERDLCLNERPDSKRAASHAIGLLQCSNERLNGAVISQLVIGSEKDLDRQASGTAERLLDRAAVPL